MLLESVINEKLREALIYTDLPKEYNKWVQRVMVLASKIEALPSYRAGGPQQRVQGGRGYYANPHKDREGDSPMTGVNAKSTANIGKPRKRARWVSEEERQKRRDEGRCLSCGAGDHWRLKCPYQPAVRPRGPRSSLAAAVAAQLAAKPELEELDTSGEEEEGDSEKE